MNYLKYSLIYILLFVSVACMAKGEFTKTIEEEFPISQDGNVSISNKYGKVDILTGSYSQVKITVTITADAKNASSASDVFDKIAIEFENDGNHVSAETDISSGKSSWWSMGKGSDNFTIDYEVEMPATCSLNLENKYGNSYVQDLGGDATFRIKYGNLKTKMINGDVEMSLGYGNAEIESCKNLDLDIKYGKAEMGSTQNADIESKYSKIRLEATESLDIESKYDDFTIGTAGQVDFKGKYGKLKIGDVQELTAEMNYTDLMVDDLRHSADINSAYGNTSIDYIGKDCSEFTFIGKYSDLSIGLGESSFSRILLKNNKEGHIKYPKEQWDVSVDIDDGSSHEIEAKSKQNKGRGTLRVDMSYGDIKIK